MKDAWRRDAQQKYVAAREAHRPHHRRRYGLSKEQLAEVEAQLAEVHSLARDAAAPGAALMTSMAPLDVIGTC